MFCKIVRVILIFIEPRIAGTMRAQILPQVGIPMSLEVQQRMTSGMPWVLAGLVLVLLTLTSALHITLS